MLRSPAPNYPLIFGLKRFTPRQRVSAARTRTPTGNRRSSSRVNKSYTCYQGSPTPPSKSRTRSMDRSKKPATSATPHHHRAFKSASRNYSLQLDDRDVLLQQGKIMISKGEFDQAINCFQQVLQKDKQNLDAMYSRAVCYMHLNEHKLALPDLLKVVKQNPLYDKQLYVAITMCFVAIKDTVSAIRHISKGLFKFPKYSQGYVIRGQLLNQQQRWDKAISDFRKAVAINPNEGGAYLGLADSLQGLGDLSAALQVLQQAISCPETSLTSLLKRAKLFYSLDDFAGSLQDFDRYLSHKSTDAEAYFYKGMLLLKQKQYIQAALSLEQSIKYDKNSQFLPQSIFHLGAIKIRERDFYGALHTFRRVSPNLQLKDQKILRSYAQAVINLMKRKYKQGIISFSRLIKKNYSVIKEYIGNCYAFRGYGYTASSQNEKALKDFKAAKHFGALDKASKFNQTISQGLVYLQKKEVSLALKYFGRASKQFPRNPDPQLYHAAVLIQNAYARQFDLSPLLQAEDLLDRAVKMRDSQSEVYFFRCILRYLLGKFAEALDDIKQAIDKAEDNIAEHYVLRGLCQASLKDHQEGMQDFSIALQLNQNLSNVYYYRGRCAYLLDDSNLAFNDFQKLILANPQDHKVHIQAGNLLMLSGSYQDALKAYSNANSLKVTNEALYLRAKNYVLLADMEAAIQELQKLLQIKVKPEVQADKEILQIIIELTKDLNYTRALSSLQKWLQNPGQIFEVKHIRWFKGVILMYQGQYQQGLQEFQKVLQIIHSHDPADMNSDDALTAQQQNCEVLYNIALCHLISNKSHSLLILQDLSQVLNSKHRGQMLFISGLIELNLDNRSRAEQLFTQASRCDPQTVNPYFNKKLTIVLPLNTSNEFSSKFPMVTLPIETSPEVRVRPAVSLPRVKPPGLDFAIEHKAREYFTVPKITPKPEAPWLNRVKGSIQFTDAIVEIESEVTEESENEKSDRQRTESDIEHTKKARSAVPLRHFSSGTIPHQEEDDEILDRIKEFCQNE